ncbi:copper resistance CopC family protein [Paenibacillus flagellatus]|uniref:CopC domain-containing protein n=1 Tax=Paenibacillus flagellatus TaxID=2211139 RepID=A0A2V5KCA1_9BACL|nr:copper resistance protein CopC [Paenibacillus flagellatus]PYI57118.1 hypothetical protein DLM86_01340 [Paenibacillus flagellatus]
MKKRSIGLFFALVLLLSPMNAWAHTGIKSSSPANGETVTSPLQEIKMEFNTEIEPLSSLSVQQANGEPIRVADLKVEKSSLSGKLDKPLLNGEYTAVWKIVGRDGHPIEGKVVFTIQLPEQADRKPETEISDPPMTGNGVADSSPSSPLQPGPASRNGFSASGVFTMIGMAVLFGLIVILMLIRTVKGKKRA